MSVSPAGGGKTHGVRNTVNIPDSRALLSPFSGTWSGSGSEFDCLCCGSQRGRQAMGWMHISQLQSRDVCTIGSVFLVLLIC